ncbi:hypothetical protein [Amnibacterium endophyticum]|uniref:Peptidase n=1 Tax=Amnibacterium endophyticum TaxID=2109337 RepID=A0ABW4LF92_9MICO
MRIRLAALVTAVATLCGLLAAAPAMATAGTPYTNVLTFHGLALNGYAARAQTAGSGSVFRVSAGWSSRHYLPYEAPRVVLQRRIGGGAWRDVRRASFTDSGIAASTGVVRVPRSTERRVVRYRFVSLAGTTSQGFRWQRAVSAPVRIVYENQQRYTGLARTAYRAMRPYCPAASVHVVDRIAGDDGFAGVYREGGTRIDLARAIGRYPAAAIRGVALHECAHQRQFLNWGASPQGWTRMTAAMDRRFVDDAAPAGTAPTRSGEGASLPFDPVEHAADCAALSVERGAYLGYGGWCSPKELRAGRALLQGRTAAR